MLRVIHDTNYDFIRARRWTTILAMLFSLPGLLLIAAVGLQWSIEFTGGTLMQVEFTQPRDAGEIRGALNRAGIEGTEIQSFGSDREFVIRAQDRRQVEQQARGAESVAEEIGAALTQEFGADAYRSVRTEAVGPKVGAELRQRALAAMLLSFGVVLIYLAWRFEWRFGVAAVLATAHDFIATMAFIWYMQLEVSLVVVGAILTVIGYSLNDTIVIFDRIRENLRKKRKESLYETINRSVNETLPRTLLTGPTSLATLLALLLLAGEVLRPFAWVMIFGVLIGTFSSIYVAAPLLLWIESRWPRHAGDKGGVGPRPHTKAKVESPRARSSEPVGTR